MTTEAQKLAEQILEHIDKHPDQHDQQHWGTNTNECNTTACVAGWAAILSNKAEFAPYKTVGEYTYYDLQITDPHYGAFEFDRLGAKLLNISDDDAHVLFFRTNEGQAKEALKYIAKGEDIPWDEIAGE